MIQALAGAKAVEGIAQNKATPYVVGSVIIVGIAVTYFGILRPIFCKTGIIVCKKDRQLIDIMGHRALDPNFSRPHKVTISYARAGQLAEKIYEAGNFWNDDEGAFYAVLEEAGSADNLSLISRLFAKDHGSLAEHIAYYMDDDDEVMRIKDILKKY